MKVEHLNHWVGKDMLDVSETLEAQAHALGFTAVEYHPPGYPGSKTLNWQRLVVYTDHKGFIKFFTKG